MSPSAAPAGRSDPGWTFEAAAECVARQDWPAARRAYAGLARQHPDHPELLCNLGLIDQWLQDWPSALEHFDQAVELQPGAGRPYLLRADLHKACNRLEAALADYDRVIGAADGQRRERIHAHANRGTTLHALGRHQEALASFDQAIVLDDGTPGLHYNRGNTLRCLGRHEEAVHSFEQALAQDPHDVQARFNLGLSLGGLGRWQAALDAADAVIRARPDHAAAHSARGDWLQNLGRAEEALSAYDESLRLQADRAAVHLNRGNTLRELDRAEAALRAYDEVVRLDPADWQGHYNRGIALHDLRRVPQALRAYSLARRLAPQEAQIEWNEALALLMGRRWHEGWLAYESRWRLEPPAAALQVQAGPAWRGQEPVQGRHLLLVAEQGLGDTLQFCRYVPHVLALGARVTLMVPAPLQPLLRSLAPGSSGFRVVSAVQPEERFDGHCPLMSLPLALHRFDPRDGGTVPYLQADPTLLAEQAQRHPRGAHPRVGLAWSGNPRNPGDARRSLALQDLLQALPTGVEPVVLQTELRPADRRVLQATPGVIHDADGLAGFARTAAWCAGLDLVLTVDTSIAHLAGALGRPTWLMLHHASDWRWLAEGQETPWYPATRLFRQEEAGRWEGVLASVGLALTAALKDRRAGPFARGHDPQSVAPRPTAQGQQITVGRQQPAG